jgi:hypothetical protein
VVSRFVNFLGSSLCFLVLKVELSPGLESSADECYRRFDMWQRMSFPYILGTTEQRLKTLSRCVYLRRSTDQQQVVRRNDLQGITRHSFPLRYTLPPRSSKGWMDGNASILFKPTLFLCSSSDYSGFGSRMANTPMVIMWINSDGTATLSQRKALSEVMPTVDSSPPRTATMATKLSVV